MLFPHLHIEAAHPAHYAAIAAIYNEYIEAGTATMEERVHSAADIEYWSDNLDERERLLVVTDAGQVIAWGVIRKYSPRAGYKFTCETSVYITRSACGKGYGTWFKQHLMNVCQSLSYHHIVAKIFATNTVSIQYNLKLGYEIVGRQTQVGFKHGQWVDVVLMQYIFKEAKV